MAVMNVIELDSDSESDPEKTLVGRGSGGAGVHDHSRVKSNEHDTTRATEGDEEESQERDSEEDDWDVESIFEDTIEEVADDQLLENNEPGACTLEEAQKFRLDLRRLGPEEFCKRTVEAGTITAKKLLTAFGLRPPAFLDGSPDDAYYGLLSLALSRELSKRIKLPQYNTVEDVVHLLQKSKKIIVLTGAGVSTSLGIPDFRSKDVGLYAQLEHLGLSDPQEVFDIELFRKDPTIFYSVAKDILPTTERFSPTHKFIWLLQNKGKLLTNYTQNIDNIESVAGILPEKIIQCHGSFASASCLKCGRKVKGEDIFDEIRAGVIPRCKQCPITTVRPTQNLKRKRSSNGQDKKRRRYSSDDDEEDDIPEAGIMKPDITFFGEQLPDHFSERLSQHDKDQVDLVITIGTSLKVAPVSEVVPYLPAHVPQIYISRQPVGHVNFDVDLLGDCDVVVAALCKAAGWNLEHEMIPKGQEIEITGDADFPSRHYFKVKR
ncbi:Sir2 family protein [Rutstroemia sp. NJR-2017a BVV2]|nr:Sir2 family protein [Rutstroemia sp. NJR-2017a BVV2]